MKRFFIFLCFISSSQLLISQIIDLKIKPDVAYFMEGKDSILSYQIKEKSLNGKYGRANYIHPLYSLDGEILTEDFPEDHRHHRGVFWAWHQLYIGDKRLGDSWDIKDFQWELNSVKALNSTTNSKKIKAEVLWKSNKWMNSKGNNSAVVKEITTIEVHPANVNYRCIDLSISLLALQPNTRIGGSENEKGYGGFSWRLRLPEDILFSGLEGTLKPHKLPIKSNGWIDLSGSYGKGKTQAGISVLCHPNNPGISDYWILRSKGSMQNAVYPFPGATAVILSQTRPTLLCYRLVIHSGSGKGLDIDGLYNEYSRQKFN